MTRRTTAERHHTPIAAPEPLTPSARGEPVEPPLFSSVSSNRTRIADRVCWWCCLIPAALALYLAANILTGIQTCRIEQQWQCPEEWK